LNEALFRVKTLGGILLVVLPSYLGKADIHSAFYSFEPFFTLRRAVYSIFMKLGINVFFCFFVILNSHTKVYAQSWQEIDLGQSSTIMSFNHFDSTLWLRKTCPIHFVDGVFTYYNNTTVPLFNFIGFSFAKPVFTSSALYSCTSGTQFFYKFDGNTFQSIDLPGDLQISDYGRMAVHNDTLYFNTLDPSGTYVMSYYQDQLIQTFSGPCPNLTVGENASYCFSGANISFIDLPNNYEIGIDNTMPSNHKILDAKLLPGTDTLFYTKIDHIRLAHGTSVIDSITASNSFQMPDGHPRKLCFDLDGNLWVLFGNTDCVNSLHKPKYVSKYNRSTQTWEHTTNLVDLLASYAGCANGNQNVELEVDPYNNIWLMFICDAVSRYYLFQQGDLPAWVGTSEISLTDEVAIIPNPSDGIFQVSSMSDEPMKITMLDQQGKQVAQFELNELSSNNSFDLSDQTPGVYFAHVSQGEQQWVKKLVVR